MASTPPGLRPILPKPPLQSEAKLNGDRVPPSIVPLSQSGSGLIDGSFSTLKRPLRPAEPAKMAPTIPQSSVNLRKRKSPPASSYETRGNAKRVEPTSKVSSMRAVPSPAKPGPTASSSNPRSEPLDFSQIRTSAPGVMPPRIKNRLFGLEHCPVFYPSHTEFTKPLEYIERIAVALKGSHYGICKIVPPENWQPPFALDTEVNAVHRLQCFSLTSVTRLFVSRHGCKSFIRWKRQQEPHSTFSSSCMPSTRSTRRAMSASLRSAGVP